MRGDPEWHAAAVRDWSEKVRPLVRNPYLSDPDRFLNDPAFRAHIYLDAERFSGYLREPWTEPFRETSYTPHLLRNRMLNELFHEAVPVILHDDDRNAMYHSIENRSPFLDRGLFDFCYTIPTRHLIRNGLAKALLDNPRKVGFNASIHSFLDVGDPAVRSQLLAPSPIFDHVRRDRIAALLDQTDLPESTSKFLFSFVSAKMFLEEFGQ
jgi:asparagine synthase (glutamine-hydrolysing)